ncbi:MAG: SCP2 domain-containing protein [Aestuariibacter sp.]
MPFQQLVTSVIENGINTLLTLDPGAAQRFNKLADKQIRVSLQEIPFALRFCFADKVLVMAEEKDSASGSDVSIAVSVWSISTLKDSSQLTRMIKSDQLQLEGDLHTAQQFSALFSELSIDWEELLAQRVGDVLAYNLVSTGKALKQKAHALHLTMQQILKDAALEEKQVAAHPLLVDAFIEDVHRINAQVDRLEQRLTQLENGRAD